MASKWTREQLLAIRSEPIPEDRMNDMLEASCADAWLFRLALEEDDEDQDFKGSNSAGGNGERRKNCREYD